jgi:hypothetical protein
MGACFVSTTFDGTLNRTELRRQYDAYITDTLHEHGTDAYNGTLTTTSGLLVDDEDRVFDTEQAAYEYVINNTQKWQEARAVKFRDVRTEDDKQPTYNGQPLRFGVGLRADKVTLRSVNAVFENGNTRVIAADQLPEAHKAKAVALYTDYADKLRAYNGLRQQIDLAIVEKFQDVKAELPTTADYAELKRLLKQRKRAYVAAEKACMKMQDFDIKQAAKIHSVKQVNYGLKWFVGGWAAE